MQICSLGSRRDIPVRSSNRQQAIIQANIDPGRCRQMASLDPNVLNLYMAWLWISPKY